VTGAVSVGLALATFNRWPKAASAAAGRAPPVALTAAMVRDAADARKAGLETVGDDGLEPAAENTGTAANHFQGSLASQIDAAFGTPASEGSKSVPVSPQPGHRDKTAELPESMGALI
jgi:hypothetical protein